jgi:hypothetical protein
MFFCFKLINIDIVWRNYRYTVICFSVKVWFESMGFSATLGNISVISWRGQFYGIGGWGVRNLSTRRKLQICRKSLTNFITLCCIENTSPWTGFELKTLVVKGTDYTGSCKSNCHDHDGHCFSVKNVHIINMIERNVRRGIEKRDKTTVNTYYQLSMTFVF